MKDQDKPEETQEELVETVNLEKASGAGFGDRKRPMGAVFVATNPANGDSEDGSEIVSDPGTGIIVSG